MPDHSINIQYIAKLSSIELSAEEIERYSAQLVGVMAHIDKLSEVDISGVEGTAHANQVSNRVRFDEPIPSKGPEVLLKNAPDQGNGQLRVPKVVDA